MSLSNGSLSKGGLSKESASKERPEADGDSSAYAPKWLRTAYGAAPGGSDGASPGASQRPVRKVVPLRMPVVPQLAPLDAPAPAPAQPASRRPTGPELLAEDEVLKRLLQRDAGDPQPLVARPTRDPVGFALGMVARLIVAGCAAAVAGLLLLGIIPLPFRLAPPVSNETAPANTTVVAAVPQKATPVATISVRAAEAAPPAAMAAQAVPAQTVLAVALPATAPPADRWALDAGDMERLLKRGADYLAQGDIAAARLLLGRAAAARDPRAALSLGATYDPTVLRQLHVVGFKPDVAQARVWYEKAAAYGSDEAAARLAALPSNDP